MSHTEKVREWREEEKECLVAERAFAHLPPRQICLHVITKSVPVECLERRQSALRMTR